MLKERPRRLRSHADLRDLTSETQLGKKNLIQPYFLSEKETEKIEGFNGVYRLAEEALIRQLAQDLELGLRHFIFFGFSEKKDGQASQGLHEEATVVRALARVRKEFGSTPILYTDVCLCPYTSHGHCGVWEADHVRNDASVEILVRMALLHAEAGADFVAPSDMMDGRVGRIRSALDTSGKEHVGILSYTAKYASNYYGPFRSALDNSPASGSDRKGYQMDYRNSREALRELRLDLAEGADMVIVKPALAYLDILSAFRQHADIPVVAYNVSGEYQMVKLMAQAGLVDESALVLENLTAMRRAGASAIISYHAREAVQKGWLT